MRTLIALLLVSLSSTLHADTLADLKAALTKLTARQPLRATYTIDMADAMSGRFANRKTSKHVSIEALHDANAIRLEVPRALLDRNDDDTREALDRISPVTVARSLDAADSFAEYLARGTVLEEKRVTYGGAPARLLVLKLKPAPEKKNGITIGSVKYAEDKLSIWIGADNVPLAADHVEKATGGFLMFKGESATHRQWQFAHHDDHLVIARFEVTTTFSGFGQNGNLHSVETVTVHS